jgi:hypothetical protein
MKKMVIRAKSPGTASSEYMVGAPKFKPKESPFKRMIQRPMLPRIESSTYIEEESETETESKICNSKINLHQSPSTKGT